jgi:hypothetical protein
MPRCFSRARAFSLRPDRTGGQLGEIAGLYASGTFGQPGNSCSTDRVLYPVDYPYEDMGEATDRFDHAPISEPDRLKIAHSNARQLFRLSSHEQMRLRGCWNRKNWFFWASFLCNVDALKSA